MFTLYFVVVVLIQHVAAIPNKRFLIFLFIIIFSQLFKVGAAKQEHWSSVCNWFATVVCVTCSIIGGLSYQPSPINQTYLAATV